MKYLLLIITLFFSFDAKADISWMKGADSCKSFAPALNAYLDKVDLSKYSIFPFWQKEELAIALREACFGKFADCNIETCKKWSSLSSFTPPQEGSNTSLFWLNRFLTCEQLMEQIKSRYSNLTEEQLSDENKQKEFKLVLSAACSDRFSHCSFASCKQFNQGKVDKSQLTGLSPIEKQEEKIVQNYEVLRANMIKLSEVEEKEKGLVWKRFSNPEEAEIVARRREESRRRKTQDGNSEQDSNSDRAANSFRRSYSSQQYSSRSGAVKQNRRNTTSSPAKAALPF